MLFLSMPCNILGAAEDSNADFKTLKSQAIGGMFDVVTFVLLGIMLL